MLGCAGSDGQVGLGAVRSCSEDGSEETASGLRNAELECDKWAPVDVSPPPLPTLVDGDGVYYRGRASLNRLQ